MFSKAQVGTKAVVDRSDDSLEHKVTIYTYFFKVS